ncbi:MULTISPECIES: restriction endonuclease subunit S [Gluconobacter]|uniref:Restriction endonuclease subunit S n=1 Tax=Gluconobacter aidae TaxID=2662454 RepID=A0A7X1SRP7_9PROT|nr:MULTISPECIES: restriction endonuclease subunit S [Gluconobacter]MBS1087040.1 restriction endonuclease subunit S [Gluconobacter sphaericus]MBS1100981.1 restriction endonuclease subunit S [Gluconobacter sphaericus]MBS1101738.1 restriction endonuclease subunit S [Gluconobacter sp. Dm-62]MQR99380.1 restriction endonuclease subunit S [Gluconobacter aidae]
MLPEGWRKASLEDVADIRSGIAKSQKTIVNPISLPYLRVANVQDGYLDLRDVKTIEIDKEKINRFSLHSGDVLMNEGGDFDKLGRGDVWRGQIMPCLHQNHVFAVRPDQNKLDSYFLANLSASPYGKGYFLSCAKRSTNLASINSTQLKQFPVILPPLPEQKKIAAILSTWDRAIEGTEKLLANSQQQKKALMQQLLTGKKRLPGFTGEWKICSLSDVATVQTATSKTQYICENGERFIVDMGSVNRLGNLVCTKSTQHNADLLPKGTLVMPKDDIGGGNIIGRTSYIDRDDLYVLGDHVYALHIGDCDSKFLHFLINSHPINKNLRRRANGTAQLGLGKKDVLRQKIKIPSEFSEQKAIAAVLTTADEEITALESDLARLRQQKKALMQQLLTGKRRVKVD